MFYFCTLFDRNYLYKGLALHHSMVREIKQFKLWALALDKETFKILKKLKLKNTVIINMNDFEDPQLLKVKPSRSLVEYYWTITPSLPLYILKKNSHIESITYVDADLFFFGSPDPIFQEMGEANVLVTEHRFPNFLQYKLRESGRFNVQFLTFRNNKESIRVLNWWRARCLEWCYFRYEDGKLGDQLYLNDWPDKFRRVHALQHKGGGLAPWNVLNYQYQIVNGKLFIDGQPLIFYHFHGLRQLAVGDFVYVFNYPLPKKVVENIYLPYIQMLNKMIKRVKLVDPTFNGGLSDRPGILTMISSFLFSQKLKILSLLNA